MLFNRNLKWSFENFKIYCRMIHRYNLLPSLMFGIFKLYLKFLGNLFILFFIGSFLFTAINYCMIDEIKIRKRYGWCFIITAYITSRIINIIIVCLNAISLYNSYYTLSHQAFLFVFVFIDILMTLFSTFAITCSSHALRDKFQLLILYLIAIPT